MVFPGTAQIKRTDAGAGHLSFAVLCGLLQVAEFCQGDLQRTLLQAEIQPGAVLSGDAMEYLPQQGGIAHQYRAHLPGAEEVPVEGAFGAVRGFAVAGAAQHLEERIRVFPGEVGSAVDKAIAAHRFIKYRTGYHIAGEHLAGFSAVVGEKSDAGFLAVRGLEAAAEPPQ